MLVLASGSPRRRAMLPRLGFVFTTARPDIDETPHAGEAAAEYVARLSREKAAAIGEDGLIIAADTTVVDGAHILGKPMDAADAEAMLKRLRGRAHVVHTGLTLHDTTTGAAHTAITTTNVEMRDYADAEIDAYIAAGEPFDKAGGYAIHDPIFHPVARIQGCYANVMGLPMCTLCGMLRDELRMNVPAAVACSPDGGWCEFDPAASH